MPQFRNKPAPYKPARSVTEQWSSFRKGLNMLLRQTELDNEELAVARNVMLVGKGVPTGRWGTVKMFKPGNLGTIRGFGSYKNNAGTQNDLLALSDEGFLVKQDGLLAQVIAGQSWPSGTTVDMEQLGGRTYITSPDKEFTEYNGTSLVVYSPLGAPSALTASNFSGVSGPNVVSWQVVSVAANGGQSLPSTNVVLSNLPTDLEKTQVNLSWSAPSHATMAGTEIYRGRPGDERLRAFVPAGVTTFQDDGGPASETILAPLTDTTGGVKSQFVAKYKDRLLLVPSDDPNKLMISGRFPNHTKFSWLDGGGYIYIDPDSGDNIKGIAVQPIADRIIVYKNRSSYLVALPLIQIGNFFVLDPAYEPISTSVGCSSAKTIATVENDTFYFGRDGLYVTGYEPQFLNILRTNEISAKIRPYLNNLNEQDYATACAFYINKKYILSFPLRREMFAYDRERGAWLGPWRTPYGISHMFMHVDATGTERWVLGSNDSNQVYRFDVASGSDDGQTINMSIRSKKTSFGDWTVLNIIQFFYVLFRNVTGTVTVNLLVEDRDGVTFVAKTFTISGADVIGTSGWGADSWGSTKWGDSSSFSYVKGGEELTRWGPLFKQGRLVQLEIVINTPNSNFEFLEAKVRASKMGEGSLSAASKI